MLRRWADGDLGPYHELCSDPEVMRYIGDGATLSLAQCEASIARFERGWERHGTSVLAAARRDTDQFIGFVGLTVPEFLPEVLPAVEIGWRFFRDQWGQGLATEGGAAALKWGLTSQRIERIVSIIQVGNDASRRVAEKLGMQLDHETTHPGVGRRLWVYAVDRLAAASATTASRSSS